jgi:hypothetical protein
MTVTAMDAGPGIDAPAHVDAAGAMDAARDALVDTAPRPDAKPDAASVTTGGHVAGGGLRCSWSPGRSSAPSASLLLVGLALILTRLRRK